MLVFEGAPYGEIVVASVEGYYQEKGSAAQQCPAECCLVTRPKVVMDLLALTLYSLILQVVVVLAGFVEYYESI